MRTTILAAALLALPLSCVPGDDGDSVTFFREAEPNDADDQAMRLGSQPGVFSVQGSCAGVGPAGDWYEGVTSGGDIEVSLYLSTDPPYIDEEYVPEETDVEPIVSLSIKSADLAVLAEANDVTPESPANLTGPAAASGTIYVQLECPARTLWYTTVIRIP